MEQFIIRVQFLTQITNYVIGMLTPFLCCAALRGGEYPASLMWGFYYRRWFKCSRLARGVERYTSVVILAQQDSQRPNSAGRFRKRRSSEARQRGNASQLLSESVTCICASAVGMGFITRELNITASNCLFIIYSRSRLTMTGGLMMITLSHYAAITTSWRGDSGIV